MRVGYQKCNSPREVWIFPKSLQGPSSNYGLDHGKTSFDKEINPLAKRIISDANAWVASVALERGVRFVQIWSAMTMGFRAGMGIRVRRDHGPLAIGIMVPRR